MFHELVDSDGRGPEELHDRYLRLLGDVLRAVDLDRAASETGIDPQTLREIVDGGAPEMTLEEAAAVLALDEDRPDAETIAAIARDELLMGMSAAVLDVEAIESGIGGELEAREIQSKVEGRFPMTLREFALLYEYIEGSR
jgi:hypothetical protein